MHRILITYIKYLLVQILNLRMTYQIHAPDIKCMYRVFNVPDIKYNRILNLMSMI